METVTQLTQERDSSGGNTTKGTRARVWSITWNNPDEQVMAQWHEAIDECERYVWQLEKGESGTPHIQGHLEYTNARTFTSLKKSLPGAHIEKVKNIKKSRDYCQKNEGRLEGPFLKGFKKEIDLAQEIIKLRYSDTVWKPWQKNVLEILDGPVDRRVINWFWDDTGNVGKSYLCKYIALKYDAIICSGKTNDIFNQVNTWRIANPYEVQIPPLVVDIPRSEFCHTNYAAIESIKNGFLYSGKYEGGRVFGLEPHVIIFANAEPHYDSLSADRWRVFDIAIISP